MILRTNLPWVVSNSALYVAGASPVISGECGDISGGIGLAEATTYLQRLGMDEVLKHEKMLTDYALKKLLNCCTKLRLYGTTDTSLKCGIIPFGIDGMSSHDVAAICNEFGIALRSGFHCAQPLHELFKLQSSARASFYIYNTVEEVDRFIDVLKEIEQL